ncbi:MAG: hypothetical protein JNJ77_17280 [Planctomycetia bacterium]|nr:hypothetical protein [Planctomycetia bacterium]
MLFYSMITLACISITPYTGESVTFSKDDAGRLPAGWEASQTGEGKGSIWKVSADTSAPSGSGFALAQTAKAPNACYNIATLQQSSFRDGVISVQLKCIAGELDQGGGLVWRYQDANNYYICRFNPLEDNYRVYKVINGKRVQLATKEELTPPKGKWHTVSVKHAGNKIECSLDGKALLTAEDASITMPGRVGLWTKADAQTHFDQLKVEQLKP